MSFREMEGITAACDSWQARIENFLVDLERHEHDLHKQAQVLCTNIFAECRAYGGLGDEELQSLIASECESAAANRHKQAMAQIKALLDVVLARSRTWRLTAEALAGFRVERVTAWERHEAAGEALEKHVRKTLKLMQAEHSEANSVREVRLDTAVTALQQAFSEEDLDKKVTYALEMLAEIEAGHRAAHGSLVGMVAAHRKAVRVFHASYDSALCQALCLDMKATGAAPDCRSNSFTMQFYLAENEASVAEQEVAGEPAMVFGPLLEPVTVELKQGTRNWQRTSDLLLSIIESAEAAVPQGDLSQPGDMDEIAPVGEAGDCEEHVQEQLASDEANDTKSKQALATGDMVWFLVSPNYLKNLSFHCTIHTWMFSWVLAAGIYHHDPQDTELAHGKVRQ
jgi:hypothetical protein